MALFYSSPLRARGTRVRWVRQGHKVIRAQQGLKVNKVIQGQLGLKVSKVIKVQQGLRVSGENRALPVHQRRTETLSLLW